MHRPMQKSARMHFPSRRPPDDGVVLIYNVKKLRRCSSFLHQMVFAGPPPDSKQNLSGGRISRS
jgi:hypothetical protein